MLLLPGRERALLDTPGYDRSAPHLLRTSSSGSIQRTVAIRSGHAGSDRFPRQRVRAHDGHSVRQPRLVGRFSRRVAIGRGDRRHVGGRQRYGSRDVDQRSWRHSVLAGRRAASGSHSADRDRQSARRPARVRRVVGGSCSRLGCRRITAFKSFLVGVHAGSRQDNVGGAPPRPTRRPSVDRSSDSTSVVRSSARRRFRRTNGSVGARSRPCVDAERRPGTRPAALTRYKIDATSAQPPRSGRAGTPSSR